MEISFIDAAKVVVPEDRQRRDFDPKRLEELVASIAWLGLLQPIILASPETNRLIAGERRLRAMLALHTEKKTFRIGGHPVDPGKVPVVYMDQVDPDMLFEMELDENVKRADLTWQERTEAIAKLHERRNAQSGGIQTIAATAEELRVDKGIASNALILAQHLHDPEVAAAKDAKAAAKIIRDKAESKHKQVLAQRFDGVKTEHTIVLGDFFELVKTVPDATFDIICTDPPYGVDADKFGEQAGTGHNYEDSQEYFETIVKTMEKEFDRICKKDAFLYVFCDFWNFPKLRDAFSLDWTVRKRPLIWDKAGTGMLPVPDYEPRNTYECILYAYRGKRQVNKKGAPDVLTYAPPKKLVHAAQKPVELLRDLLSRVSVAGDSVLDCFCGSGSIFPAATRLRLKAVGWEKEESNHLNAKLRMLEDPSVREELEEADADDIEL